MSVFMRLQFIGEVVVIKALMTVVPQFNCPSVNVDIPCYIRATVVKRQHFILCAYAGIYNITACFCSCVFVATLAWMQFRQVSQKIIDDKKIFIY